MGGHGGAVFEKSGGTRARRPGGAARGRGELRKAATISIDEGATDLLEDDQGRRRKDDRIESARRSRLPGVGPLLFYLRRRERSEAGPGQPALWEYPDGEVRGRGEVF